MAQELSHPFTLACAFALAAWLHQSPSGGASCPRAGRDGDCALDRAGFPFWVAVGNVFRGWALAEQDKERKGLPRYVRVWLPTGLRGQRLQRPYFLALLAEAYGKVGQAEEGLDVLAEALDAGGENWRALLRSGAVSAERGADAPMQRTARVGNRATNTDPQSPSPLSPCSSRGVFPQSHRNCPKAASQVAGTTRGDEPGPAATTASDAARITYTRNTKHAPCSTKHTQCYPRSTTGSPKGLTRRTCKRQRRCYRS